MTTDVSTSSGPPTPAPTSPRPTSRVLPVVIDVAIVLGWFAVAGVVGAWIWATVTPLPQATKTGSNATVAAEELVKQVGMDGWFFVIAGVGGLLSGVLLVWWRDRDPLLTVALVALGGGLASWLMIHAGKAFGPDDAVETLRTLPDGSKVPEQLVLHAQGVAWVWPIAAVFGALLFLWVLAKPGDDGEPGEVSASDPAA